jgi:crotonobetainyl-CoA:carnitine CoA-transferase CaiB-like acyl-CoA transferase
MVSHIMQDYLIGGVAPPRFGNGGNGGGPADVIRCNDGIMYLSAGGDEHWRRLTVLMEQPGLYEDERFNSNMKRAKLNRAELIDLINDWSSGFTTADLQAMFDGVGIPAARYNDLADVWEDPQVQHRGLRATTPHAWAESGSVDLIASPLAHMSATPATIRSAPPLIGEHTEQLLSELGYDEARIEQLREANVI